MSSLLQLILYLVQNDWLELQISKMPPKVNPGNTYSALGNLVRSNNLSNLGDPWEPGLIVCLIART